MRDTIKIQADNKRDRFQSKCKNGTDFTGRDRLVTNVIFSWVAHFTFIITGFIMPRMIDRRLGQDLLGTWDFAWSLVNYFGLVQAGIHSSVNRYVARYRAAGDTNGMNQVVSSASCVLGIAGFVVLGLTIAVSLLLPQLFGTRLGENVHTAQWVVFFLGASIVIEISFNVFSGVLTGCHRWELHNIIKSGWHVIMVAGMIIALIQGGSLPSLAVICFLGYLLAYTTRMIVAHWVCEGLRLRPSLIKWKTIKKLFFFGGKTLIPSVSNLLLNQTTSILIVVYMGPAALALYTRPRSLIHHLNTIVQKLALTLTPTISSLQSTGNLKEIRELTITSVRYSLYVVLPIVLLLLIFGGPILKFWMGPRYANSLIPAVMAVGYLATITQEPVLKILAGLNAHGRAGIAKFIASICSAGLTILALGHLKWGLVSVAVAVTLPLAIMSVVYLPVLICRRVDLDVKQYFVSVSLGPAVHILPFTICLVAARIFFNSQPLTGLILGGTAGCAILAVLYWKYVLPKSVRIRIMSTLGILGAT